MSKSGRKILLVNDDGYKAAGIRALYRELSNYYDITAVSPAQEQSWMAKSISGHHGLHPEAVEYYEYKGYMVNGTPADCAQLGIYNLMETHPDFVVSGLNHGANIGHAHILSSGTVGAALEAALQGVPAFAASVWQLKHHNKDVNLNDADSVELLSVAAEITRKVVDKVMAAGFPDNAQVIAINMPYDVKSDAPWAITRPHHMAYGQLFSDIDGEYRNTGSSELNTSEEADSDLAALAQGYVSIVPLNIELTSDAGQAELSKILALPVFGK